MYVDRRGDGWADAAVGLGADPRRFGVRAGRTVEVEAFSLAGLDGRRCFAITLLGGGNAGRVLARKRANVAERWKAVKVRGYPRVGVGPRILLFAQFLGTFDSLVDLVRG